MTDLIDDWGFTRQTSVILRGLGAENLIPEFEKRNISTAVLYELNKQDFRLLGADEEQVDFLIKTLNVKKRNDCDGIPSSCTFLKIIEIARQQLSLLDVYTVYCRARLDRERINVFINPDRQFSASNILLIAVDAAIAELEDAELAFNSFQALTQKKAKKFNSQHVRNWMVLCGTSLAICVIMCRFPAIRLG